MRQKLESIGNSALSLISSTVIILPFMMFLKLASRHTVIAVLPFVIFYTFRMTGVFFIRGIRTTINSYTLLKLAIYCGLMGAVFGLLGLVVPGLASIAGGLLGLSAAWLPMANATINAFKQENALVSSKRKDATGLFLILLGSALGLPLQASLIVFFCVYGLMYLCSLFAIAKVRDYKITSHELEGYSYWYLSLFGGFFCLIFALRASRLLVSVVQFDYFLYGTLFFILCVLGYKFLTGSNPQRKVSRQVSMLTLVNGAVGNYLFLFSSLYIAGYYGHRQLFMLFYLPYVLGLLLASRVAKFFDKHTQQQWALVGIVLGLLVGVSTPVMPIAILIISLFKGVLNKSLNTVYLTKNTLPKDKRMWVKYTIQGIGSILNQFILMIIGSVLVLESQRSIQTFFMLTSQTTATATSQALMQVWNVIATGILLLIILLYGIMTYQQAAKGK
ncbi:hypothetical protein JOC59_001202 [Weissella beninensis]|uniref:MFS transporter n=1 Tax=Periweissella beninensis TaxID=504936 RepID=A0ABT0VGX0_9LACO|nr:hypothetical protein [Periweissella beninensis]MBM7544485.1 hypothetical protein [Periweissella beninensis]MCM2437040.1 hypothetical protein [Periweissella beninensis]